MSLLDRVLGWVDRWGVVTFLAVALCVALLGCRNDDDDDDRVGIFNPEPRVECLDIRTGKLRHVRISDPGISYKDCVCYWDARGR